MLIRGEMVKAANAKSERMAKRSETGRRFIIKTSGKGTIERRLLSLTSKEKQYRQYQESNNRQTNAADECKNAVKYDAKGTFVVESSL